MTLGCVATVWASSLASQLLQLVAVVHGSSVRRRYPVGAGLPAKAECQATSLQLTHRFRCGAAIRQASSYSWSLSCMDFVYGLIT